MDTTLFSTRHVTPTTAPGRPPAHGERALVLGGGGAVGNAWLIGILAGLCDAGLDVTDADLVIGTSAGSTAAAQLTGASPTELFAAVVAAAPPHRPGPAGAEAGRRPAGPASDLMERTGRIINSSSDPADMRRRMGAAALEATAASGDPGGTRWRATVAARLTGARWPERALEIVAVDARTGEPVVFDGSSGVDLVDAVAASCANGFAYPVGDSSYIDGGYRRGAENADLAAGYERVLVLSPLGGRTRAPLDWGMKLAVQADELRALGSRVEAILPDDRALEAFGEMMTDLSRRPAAVRAGFEQGSAQAARLTPFWR